MNSATPIEPSASPLDPRVLGTLRSVRESYKPDTKLTPSQFSDAEIILTSGPLAGTRWNTDNAPYQRGILDAFHEKGVQFVIVMGSSQWGKTAILVNLCAFHMAHDPCHGLVVTPTRDPMARDFSKNRLDPVIEASPTLRAAVYTKRAKGGNSAIMKSFVGGSLSIAGANSAASLAARPIRFLGLDEVDRYKRELKGEGSTISIAIKRTLTFKNRRRVFMCSSPTIENNTIHDWYERGDQRRYLVPCQECGAFFAYEWSQIKWERDDPKTARIECPHCRHHMSDAERVAALATNGGAHWEAQNPDRPDKRIVSFHIWEAYSPMSSLEEMVSTFLAARRLQKSGDEAEMHTFQNTTLGEPRAIESGDGVEAHELLSRREEYAAEVPARVCLLTLGVDTQDDRLEVVVIGWAPGEEAYIVLRDTLSGDPSQQDVWDQLDGLLDREFQHESGVWLSIASTCIDSAGHRTTYVYDYVQSRRARKVHCIIGRDGERPIVSSPSQKLWGKKKRKVPLYTVGTDAAKAIWYSRFKLTQQGPGYVHLPSAEWCDAEMAEQLTSEGLAKRRSKGILTTFWKKFRPRNEAWDCVVYGLAALRLLHVNLEEVSRKLLTRIEKERETPDGKDAPKPAEEPQRAPGWIPRRANWLRGNRPR